MQQNTTTQTFPDPQILAKQTATEIMKTIKKRSKTEDMLTALELHYETLHKSQEIYLTYMTEFVKRLKETQQKDVNSLLDLKKEVLRHIMDIEKDKQST